MAILKMNIMPSLLYLIKALPISITQSFFKTVWSRFIRFVLVNSHLSYSYFAIIHGGWCSRNPLRYFYALHLSRVIAWFRAIGRKPWNSFVPISHYPTMPTMDRITVLGHP